MILIYILLTILLSFAEFIFTGFGLGSLVLPLFLLFFEKKNIKNRLLIFCVLYLFIFDVGLHLPIGSYLIATFIGCTVFWVFSRFSQLHNKIVRFAVVFICMLVMNLTLAVLIWTFNFTSIIASSALCAVWFTIMEFVYDSFRHGTSGKIKV